MTGAGAAWRIALIFAVGIGGSYLLARAGEPQSAWFWCTVLNLCE